MYDQGLTLKAAAERLGYSYNTVRRMVLSGEIHAYGRGKLTRIPTSEIMRFMSIGTAVEDVQALARARGGTRDALSQLEQLGVL